MTPDDLAKSVRTRRRRAEQARREGERPMARNIALVGSLAWLIVLPIVMMVFLGHWLDRRMHSGALWTAVLVFVGAGLGSWLAWRRMQEP